MITIIIAIFSFIFIVVGNNAYAQFDKFTEKQENITVANLTDHMNYSCLKIDAGGGIGKIEDKEQKEQCQEFLDRVSIFELNDLIGRYMK